jgi:hypothetical protein
VDCSTTAELYLTAFGHPSKVALFKSDGVRLMRSLKLLFAGCFVSTIIFSSDGKAQNPPNAEQCLHMTWGYLKSQGYEYSAINTCAYPVDVSFMTGTGKMLQATVQAGQGFRSGLTIKNFEADRSTSGWIGTVCRSGEVPSLNVSASNWKAILKGDYECRKP